MFYGICELSIALSAPFATVCSRLFAFVKHGKYAWWKNLDNASLNRAQLHHLIWISEIVPVVRTNDPLPIRRANSPAALLPHLHLPPPPPARRC
jgi:hypothetical protein